MMDDHRLLSKAARRSSIPDDELLTVAERGGLSDTSVLEGQVRRMLADPRSRALVTNFAGQWLHGS